MKRLVLLLVLASLSACDRKPASPPAISFKHDIEPVLAQNCASAKGCHGVQHTKEIDMDLREGHSYDNLVSVASETRPGAFRVQPGNVANSFIVSKLSGTITVKEGKPMPLDPETLATPERSPLPDRFLKDVLEPWIRAGAPNN